MTNWKIRKSIPEDAPVILSIAYQTEVFEEGEVSSLLGSTIDQFYGSKLNDSHQVWVIEDAKKQSIAAWSYFAESAVMPGAWDVWWIGADLSSYGSGAAQEILSEIEQEILNRQGRIVVIETSSDDRLARARAFYRKVGYEKRGEIPDYYGRGKSKIIFSKTLAP